MAYTLECEVKVGAYLFRKVNDVSITSTWRNLSDECTIRLPSLARQLERGIKAGDRVEVRLRYTGYDWQTEFSGYVAEVQPTIPLSLRCEDEAWKLKRTKPISAAWRSITLRALLRELVPTAVLADTIPAVTLAPFRLDRVTVYEALRKLKEEYLLAVYFRAGQLFVGLPYTEFDSFGTVPGRLATYDLERNIVADNLTYKRADEVRLRARVINILPTNKRVEVEVGDPDGEQRTIHLRNATTDPAALKVLGERELARYRYEGYRGTLVAFGLPYVVHSGAVNLRSSFYPQRAGRYLVDSVKTSFGTGGFRREIELGPKTTKQ